MFRNRHGEECYIDYIEVISAEDLEEPRKESKLKAFFQTFFRNPFARRGQKEVAKGYENMTFEKEKVSRGCTNDDIK
ncbi:hypothetical protein QR680_017645 [Steinernema hermaphroditum]|uniref:Uncharacterized protein n=1 Tax=Steinernema hermaphroditum TaxID=289476 RepID=A0AA39HHH6_9BILA|nr:hypothetical protein QR680_017645 [Steinernema hermaphroditum]